MASEDLPFSPSENSGGQSHAPAHPTVPRAELHRAACVRISWQAWKPTPGPFPQACGPVGPAGPGSHISSRFPGSADAAVWGAHPEGPCLRAQTSCTLFRSSVRLDYSVLKKAPGCASQRQAHGKLSLVPQWQICSTWIPKREFS